MTAATAPSGLKLTEEQVTAVERALEKYPSVELAIDETELEDLCSDWRTLRAACDAKDAEIARLQQTCDIRFDQASSNGSAAGEWKDRATRAEARLVAMATVTADDVETACAKWSKNFEPNYWPRKSMRAALEAFVANKTAGRT